MTFEEKDFFPILFIEKQICQKNIYRYSFI